MPYYIQEKIMEVFLHVLNTSLNASAVIAIVLVARLILKKAPKIFSYALWGVVFFRLLCPFSIESALSLLPFNASLISTNTIRSDIPQISTGVAAIDNAVNPILPTPITGGSVNPLQIAATVGEVLWLVGLFVLLAYSIASLFRLQKKLVGAVKLQENIYLADHITSPFVIGVFHPKIYLPSTLSQQEQGYIILHEQTHIRRLDYILKIVAFAALCIHWFNPLVWIAFTLAIKDMEMACDESVLKQLGADIRGEYSTSLLCLATGRRIIAGTPLAFGEGDTKSRIKNVLHYKKPVIWVVLAALIVVAVICVAFASNPQRASMTWAKSLHANDIAKIELVVMPSDENERYRLLERSEFSNIVALVNNSRGGYLPNPEDIAGGGLTYYITTTDGERHVFGNNGNTYLFIDGDNYNAGYNWLSPWGNEQGNAPIPETFLFGNEKFLTIAELNFIAQHGKNITWDDFASYSGQEVGFGLYIMRYPMEQTFYVTVGGTLGEEPMYIRLCSTATEEYIDIRQDSINEYVSKWGVSTDGLTLEITAAASDDAEFLLNNQTENIVEYGNYNRVEKYDGDTWSEIITNTVQIFPPNPKPLQAGDSMYGMTAWTGANIKLSPGIYRYNMLVNVYSDNEELSTYQTILSAKFEIIE